MGGAMKEALKLALEALEGYESCIDAYYAGAVCPQIDKAITALREALAEQPAQQEPMAWEQFYHEMGKPKLAYLSPTESPENACYVPPAQRKPLTDEEIYALYQNTRWSYEDQLYFARAIEAAHGIKENT